MSSSKKLNWVLGLKTVYNVAGELMLLHKGRYFLLTEKLMEIL